MESKRKHVINIYIFVLVFGMESIWFVWVYCFHWYCANCENLSLSNYRLFHKTVPFLAELQFEYQTVSIVTLLVKCSRITTPNIYSPYICLFTIYIYKIHNFSIIQNFFFLHCAQISAVKLAVQQDCGHRGPLLVACSRQHWPDAALNIGVM